MSGEMDWLTPGLANSIRNYGKANTQIPAAAPAKKQKKVRKPIGQTIDDILGFAQKGAGIFATVKNSFKKDPIQNTYNITPGQPSSSGVPYAMQGLPFYGQTQPQAQYIPTQSDNPKKRQDKDVQQNKNTMLIVVAAVVLLLFIFITTRSK